ncbi:MAG: hypothetical protein ABIJ16_02935 [Bacteroidota bacterium]
MKYLLSFIPVILLMACNTGQKAMTMEDSPDKKITITGTAENGKGRALLVTDKEEVYSIEGMDSWEDEVLHKKVEVSGILKKVNHDPADLVNEKGEYSQGMAGDELIISSPEWKVLK